MRPVVVRRGTQRRFSSIPFHGQLFGFFLPYFPRKMFVLRYPIFHFTREPCSVLEKNVSSVFSCWFYCCKAGRTRGNTRHGRDKTAFTAISMCVYLNLTGISETKGKVRRDRMYLQQAHRLQISRNKFLWGKVEKIAWLSALFFPSEIPASLSLFGVM